MKADSPYILMLGCFDTKEEVFSFLRDQLLAHGLNVLTLNTGVLGTTALFPVDYEAEQVAQAAGHVLEAIREKQDRGFAVDVMGQGAARLVADLVKKGGMQAAIGMGGGGGTYITLAAMQSIPLGVPKLCLTTLATKDLSRQIGIKDITLVPSVVDLAGLNSISSLLISQAAAAISAMSRVKNQKFKNSGKSIAISMFGNTTACVDRCSKLLNEQGYETMAFHATGVGGQTMEALIRENYFAAVLDVTTTELADDLCGGILSAGPERLTAAAEMGIPQVVVPGCLDMVNFAQKETVPRSYHSRQFYNWAPDVTLMRTNAEENQQLGEQLATKLNGARGPVTIVLPLRGISQISASGGVFHRPEVDQVLFSTIKAHAKAPVQVKEVDAHINDAAFADFLVSTLLEMIQENQEKLKEKANF
ncbi:Tm-1-like ATP-binding domain-containing protein [Adhaeribacter swui]|uniref:Tm-1-like ATP-binding domain-containing protein n=1 Tax=Adhaeribacter swui TaxID=2086471 RepID=A0A7G7G538_9BACT|nr:Tm-1-like ATP-binding domain-containing protein [Adhaeribacter swui]QNF32272.1 Tm-1-like ATP-binding domain-containing protein [Adhaeribacter swui]